MRTLKLSCVTIPLLHIPYRCTFSVLLPIDRRLVNDDVGRGVLAELRSRQHWNCLRSSQLIYCAALASLARC